MGISRAEGRGPWFALAWGSVIVLAVGCGGRAEVVPGAGGTSAGGSAGSGGHSGGTGGSAGSSAGGTGGAPSIQGYVRLNHVIESEGYSWEQLTLSATFYGEPYDPEVDRPDYIETRMTTDGVPCDIYYQSGMIDEEPPPPPPQLDGGRITAWSGFDGDSMEITFEGEQYSVDAREGSVNPMPGWLTEGAVAVTFEGHGSAAVSDFAEEATLASIPVITDPPSGQSQVSVDTNGDFRIAWQPAPADATLVQLGFNLDWDNSAFICHPPSGTTELRLPAAWLSQWTWGSGELAIVARHEVSVSAGDAAVTIRTSRFPRKSVQFDIGW